MDLRDEIAVRCEAQDKTLRAVCVQEGLGVIAPEEIVYATASELDREPSGKPVVLAAGQWPGLAGQSDQIVASATSRPWIDSNGFWIPYLKAFYPRRPAVIGYRPESKLELRRGRVTPRDTMELALLEAWAFGGNAIVAPPASHRASLVRNPEVWRSLARAARWLRENRPQFRQPMLPAVTALVEKGEDGAEFANLLYRHGAAPTLAPSVEPPAPGRVPLAVLGAIHITAPSEEARRRILAHAESGSTVVVDAGGKQAWWRVNALKPLRRFEDREFFGLGRGVIVAYKEVISDPSSYASDIVDLITPRRRPVRVWNVPAGIVLGTAAPGGGVNMHILNYGWPIRRDTLAQARGVFQRALLLRPEGDPIELKPVRRGPMTEVMIPEIGRLAVVSFSEERT